MRVLASLAILVRLLHQVDTPGRLEAILGGVTQLLAFDDWLLILDGCAPERPVIFASAGVRPTAAPGQQDLVTALRAIHRTERLGFVWAPPPASARFDATPVGLSCAEPAAGAPSAFTVPIHGPDHERGSWTLIATANRSPGPRERLLVQSLAPHVYEAGLRLAPASPPPARLTPRQRACLLWAARGKTHWEIARILAVREGTVEKQLARARERYGVDKTSIVIVRALFDGTLTFAELMEHE